MSRRINSRGRKKREDEDSVCEHDGKHIFRAELDAFRGALRLSHKTGKPIRIYTCPQNAKALHLTSRTA